MSTTTVAAASSLPPVAHAIGGSFGSTVSMLLLYPLERVRIEMQASALDNVNGGNDGDFNSVSDENDEKNDRTSDSHQNCSAKRQEANAEATHAEYQLKQENASETPSSPMSSPSAGSESSISSFELLSSTNSPIRGHSESPSKQIQPPPTKNKPKSSSLLATLYHLHIQKTLYKGSTPIALTLALSNFIFFYTLQATKSIFQEKSTSLLTSTIAGVINVMLTNPFWVANLRLVKDTDNEIDAKGNIKTKGLLQCLKEIWKKEGVGQLWAGTGASLLLVSNPVIQYYVYENVKLDILKRRQLQSRAASAATTLSGIVGGRSSVSLAPMEAFVVGAVAKGLATVVTYPLQLAQVLMRLQKSEKENALEIEDDYGDDINYVSALSSSNSTGNKVDAPSSASTPIRRGGGQVATMRKYPAREKRVYNNLFDCIKTLYRQGGIRALYSGMDAKLLQAVLTSAITFLTYEQILHLVAKSYWLLKRLENGSANSIC